MNSKTPGKSASAVEVTHISKNGFWILAHDRELFLAFKDFPWFKDAPVGKILNVEELCRGHFYWPDLDIDLTVEIIEHPERYPLIARCT